MTSEIQLFPNSLPIFIIYPFFIYYLWFSDFFRGYKNKHWLKMCNLMFNFIQVKKFVVGIVTLENMLHKLVQFFSFFFV